jgi:predicted kinase
MNITIPELSLVVLVGPSGSGKSTFARKHFKPTEILSSDYCRGVVADDETEQAATKDAFEVLHFIAGKRLAAGRLTVVDATNVQPEARKPLVALARQYHCLPVALVLNLPEKLCQERTRERADRDFGPHVIRQQCQQLRRSLGSLRKEGFSHVFVVQTPDEVSGMYCCSRAICPTWIGGFQGVLHSASRLLSATSQRDDRMGFSTRWRTNQCVPSLHMRSVTECPVFGSSSNVRRSGWAS